MSGRRGTTLLELMISMAILLVVVTMATMLTIEGVMFSRRGQELADANEAAHLAGNTIVAALQQAGLGMENGLLVVGQAATPTSTNTVIVTNRTDGPDELWVVRPHRRALLESCGDEGAATTVQRTGFGVILARCAIVGWDNEGPTALSGPGAALLLAVTNLKRAALLTKATFERAGAGVSLGFREADVPGFGDDTTSGFRQGDLVMPVRIDHYFVGRGAGGGTALLVEPGTVGAKRYPEPTGVPRVVQEDIEDLQLAVGIDDTASGNPERITWSYGLDAPFRPGVRSVRVSVVARSPRAILSTDGSVQTSGEYAPMSVEDHVVSKPVRDGHRRTLFSRRVELVNLSPEDL
jgi:prepilin-type N-terminal cleavage/methylation domain-containing protein